LLGIVPMIGAIVLGSYELGAAGSRINSELGLPDRSERIPIHQETGR
jgi:hypothetical protein